MDLNDLARFTRVVEKGSFTAAAKALGLPKSSVTRGIARLESSLNVRLIQRTTRQRGLTDAGRELYERVRGAVGVLEEASAIVREHGHESAGVVRVTAVPDATMMGITEAIAELREARPKIHVELILTSRVIDLVAEGVDLAVRAGPLADSSLVATKIGETSAGLFASPAYLKKHGTPSKISHLKDHHCILFRGKNGRGTWSLAGPRGPQTVELEGIASVDDFGCCVNLVAKGLGIGRLPLFLAHRHGGLKHLLPGYTMQSGPLHVVMPSGSFVPARVTAVRDALVRHLSRALKACDGPPRKAADLTPR